MNIYSLPAIISLTVNFSIALIILMESPKATLNRWFAAFVFSFASWNLAEILILNNANFSPAMFGAQILYLIIFLTPAFFVIIAYLFPKNFRKFSINLSFPIAVFALPILLLSLSFPEFQVKLVMLKEMPLVYYYHFTFSFKPVFLLLLFVSLSYIIWGNFVLIKKIRRLRTIRQKYQTRFFAIGMDIIFISFISILLLKVTMRNPGYFYFLSTIFSFVVATFFFVVLIRFQLFKPGRLLSGGITYSIFSAFVLAVYFFVIRIISSSVESILGIDSTVFDVFLIIVLIFIILPFEKRLQNLIDRWVNKNLYQYRKNILTLFRKLQTYHETADFFKIISRFIKDNFRCEKIYIFNYHEKFGRFEEISLENKAPSIPEQCTLTTQLKQKKSAIEFYELSQHDLSAECHQFFEERHTHIFVPLIFEEQLMAIIVLGRKKFGLEYNEVELEILSIFGNEVAAALYRNRIIEKAREKDRRNFRLEKLAALGQLTAGVAHEIRNPLNTISTSAETLLQPDISESDQNELKQFIIEEADRLNRILNDFLNLSRIKPANFVEINVEDMFNRLCLELQALDYEDIRFMYEFAGVQKTVISDPDLLFQVLLNLGLNARGAIKERCMKELAFSCQEGLIKCLINSVDKRLIISISDNGVGIPPEVSESIYNPFFTTKENGTGLGLAIVHQIVDVLSGSIEFTSRAGETIFTLYLPNNPEEYKNA